MPLYFDTLAGAEKHAALCKRLIGDLTGQESMRIERWTYEGEWEPV